MAGFWRAKRVTDPLNDDVKARIVGKVGAEPDYVSSGSEHGGDDESPCLSDLVHGFLVEDAGGKGGESPECESDSEETPSMSDPTEAIEDLINRTAVISNEDSFRHVLFAHVSKAIEMFSCLRSNRPVFHRNVMVSLRDSGYNAAICKTKWESSGGLTAGNYEFIDVLQSDSATSRSSHRYFVDLDFAGEFEIARPATHYEHMLKALPRVFVGRSEDLKQIVKVMSDAAKRSLKSRGLSLPPWRKNRYMQNKWFGPYRRTTNLIPANSPSVMSPSKTAFAVKCRSVGFDPVNGRLLFPVITRTR